MPAADVEAAVIGALRQIADGVAPTGQGQDGAGTDRDLIDIHVAKVVIRRNAIEITKRNLGSDAPAAPVVLPWSPAPAYHRREIIVPPGADRSGQRPIRAESRARLVEGIAKARLWLNELIDGRVTDTKEIAAREGCSDRSIRMFLSLAFLAPAILRAAWRFHAARAAGGLAEANAGLFRSLSPLGTTTQLTPSSSSPRNTLDFRGLGRV